MDTINRCLKHTQSHVLPTRHGNQQFEFSKRRLALLGNLASLHTPESGFTMIRRPAFDAAVRPIQHYIPNQPRVALPSKRRRYPRLTPYARQFRELCNIGDAEGVTAANLKILQGGSNHAPSATTSCNLLGDNCAGAQCQGLGLRRSSIFDMRTWPTGRATTT